MTGMLGRLGHDVQEHPASGPTCPGLEPRSLGKRVGRVEGGQGGHQIIGAPATAS